MLAVCRIFLLIVALPVFVAIAFYIKLKPTDNRHKMMAWGCNLWARFMCVVFNIKVSSNFASMPTSSFIVSNHLSYTDIFVLASQIRCSFIAKAEMRGWALMGWLAEVGGTIFVQRDSSRASAKLFDDVKAKLQAGVNVVLFAEGTTSDGSQVLPFKSMFFQIPAELEQEVHPVIISYSQDNKPCNRAVAWHGDMSLLPHTLKLLCSKYLKAHLHLSEPIKCPDDTNLSIRRKVLANKTFEVISEMFQGLSKP